MSTQLEIRLYGALKRITAYMPPEKLRKVANRKYGLEGDEAIEMAYENVLSEARGAIAGVRIRREPDRASAAKRASVELAEASGSDRHESLPSPREKE